MTFLSALKTTFELKPNQTLLEFKHECDALTYKDRMDLYGYMRNQGIVCDPPAIKPGEVDTTVKQ